MGWSTRAYLVDKGGEIQRIPYARFERLWKSDPEEKFPDYAGSSLRVAIAYVETVNRKPLLIRHVDYLRIKLDDAGRIDMSWFDLALRLAGESIALPWLGTESSHSNNLLHAEHLFAKRRYRHECNWEPSETQREAITELALT
jgi:hypothetical protein